MTEISGLDLHFLTKELQTLIGGRIEKIYQWNKQEFLFKINTKTGKKELKINLPNQIFITNDRKESPQKPLHFCEYLRKHIQKSTIEEIKQHGFERILEIYLKYRDQKQILIIELFRPGNIILVEGGIIKNSLETKNFKDRKIEPKEKFQYPPLKINTKTSTKQEILEILNTSKTEIAKTLATKLGFGGKYADEITKRANLQKNLNFQDLKQEQKENLIQNIQSIFKQDLEPEHDEKEAYSIHMTTIPNLKKTNTLSKAIQNTQNIEKEKPKEDKKIIKVKKVIEQQEQRMIELKKEIQENQQKAEKIYEKYQEIKQILDEAKKTFKEKNTESLKENEKIKKIDKKDKKITIKL
ncbi:NFACT family protein [Candidatus Woesearchaeota archaeon]|nr:NFACT family protein [Candidatus Woesearchaeota archaeon]